MNAAAIIREVMADGVNLTLSPAGTIKATGEHAAVSRWLPTIREHKSDIVAALQTDPAVIAILAWLTCIGETHQPTIDEVLTMCANDPTALSYYLKRSIETPTNNDKADAFECGMTDCRDCRRYRGDDRVCGANRCPTPKTLFRRCESFSPKSNAAEPPMLHR